MQHNEHKKVSVGMPVYNGAEYLRDAIDSILAQTYRNIELVISDNASTDATESICREYQKNDARVKYFRNDVNLGASGNYNAAFLRSGGDYFKWASSNDHCDPRFVEKCVVVLDANPDVAVCYPRTRLFRDSIADAQDYQDNLHLDQPTPFERFRALHERIRLNNAMNGLIRREFLTKTSLIKTYYSSDVIMMAELALYGRFYEVDEYLFYRRMDEKTATALKSEQEVVEHYVPSGKSIMAFQSWKFYLGYLSGIHRAAIDGAQKRLLYRYVAMLCWYDKRALLKDCLHALTSLPKLLRA